MAYTGGCLYRIWKIFTFEPERHVDQGDQHRHLHQGTDYRRKGLPGVDAEHGDSHGDGQLEVVGGGGKG